MAESTRPTIRELLPAGSLGVVATSSVDFVRQVLGAYSRGIPVVALRGSGDDDRRSAADVRRVIEVDPAGGWLGDVPFAPSDAEDIAQISFTSGTQGVPKGVLLSHRALRNTQERIVDAMSLDASIREYVGIPVYHSFGFGRCRSVLSVGGDAYVPPNGFDLTELATMLERGEVNAVSAVPTLWRLVLSHASRFERVGSSVAWIEIGSQAMTGAEKAHLRALFPRARIVQHYGLTEASRTTFISVDEASEVSLPSVGRPSPPVEVEVSSDGRIRIRGPHLASGFLIEGRVEPIGDDDGWLTTSDEGYFDEDGFLHFVGRADDLINCGGIKLVPESVERRIEEGLGATDAVRVARVPDTLRGDGVLVAYVPERVTLEDVRATATSTLAAEGVSAASAIVFRPVEAFPTTDTGKLRRAELAALVDEPELEAQPAAAGSPDDPPQDPIERFVAGVVERVFDVRGVGLGYSILDGGADSLRAVELVADIDAEYGVELSLADLHRAPTVRGIADSLRWSLAGTERTGAKYLVPLCVGNDTSLPALFIVGGSYGNVLHLADLASGLEGAANVYGLQYRGLIDEDEPRETFAEAATDFLSEMEGVGTPGGAFLAGYSGGGLIAVEMARQLIDRGEAVGFLGLLDTRLPARPPYQAPFSIIERVRIGVAGNRAAGHGVGDVARQAVAKLLRLLRGRVGLGTASPHDLDAAALEELSPTKRRSELIHAAFVRACARYTVPELPLPIHYFRPADQVTYPLGRTRFDFVDGLAQRVDGAGNGWERFGRSLEVVDSPGGHYDFAHAEHAAELALRMREAIVDATGR